MIMRLKIICFSAFLVMFVIAHVDARVMDIVSNQKNAFVSVYVDDRNKQNIESGSGFIVDQSGAIVTNCRVVEKWITELGATLSVEIAGRGRVQIEEVISSRCENNLVLLKIKAADLPVVKVAREFKPRQGQDILVMKGGRESFAAISSGTIRSVNEKSGHFRISVPVKQDESGSPLFNAKGEVVGVAIVETQRGKPISSAVSMKGIIKQIDRYKKQRKLIEGSITHSRADSTPGIKTDDTSDFFSRGCAYDQLNMYKEAVAAYQQSLKSNPDFTETYINLGIDYYRMGQYNDAINTFKQAIQIKPGIASLYTKLGATYIVNGEYLLATDILKKAIEIDPENSSAHFNLGIAYYLSGNTLAAQKECTILRDLDKTRADSLINLMD